MSYFKSSNDLFPPIVKSLIAINVVVWVAQLYFDKQLGNPPFQLWLTDKLALYPLGSAEFKPYQIVTHMFAHASYSPSGKIVFEHILFNLYGLWMFGRILENKFGGQRFLFLYLISGLGAAALHLLIGHFTGAVDSAVGASGAIMGVFAAFGYLFPNTELFIFFIPFPIKAKWVMIGFVAIDLFSGIGNFQGDNVAHFAHLGGALTGFLIVLIWNRTNRRHFY